MPPRNMRYETLIQHAEIIDALAQANVDLRTVPLEKVKILLREKVARDKQVGFASRMSDQQWNPEKRSDSAREAY